MATCVPLLKYSISGPYFLKKKLFITFVNNRAPMKNTCTPPFLMYILNHDTNYTRI